MLRGPGQRGVSGNNGLRGCVLACLVPLAAAQGTPAVPRFVEETDTAGLQSRFEGEGEYMVGGGVATFDCDGDGLPDVYVTAGVNKAKFTATAAHAAGPSS